MKALPIYKRNMGSLSILSRTGFMLADFLLEKYLEDMTDQDLLVPIDGLINNWNSQLAHLINSEVFHIGSLGYGQDIQLSDAFLKIYADQQTPGKQKDYLSKEELLREQRSVRNQSLAILDAIPETDHYRAPPETLAYFAKDIHGVFTGEVAHWSHHLSQLAIIRKHLGKTTF